MLIMDLILLSVTGIKLEVMSKSSKAHFVSHFATFSLCQPIHGWILRTIKLNGGIKLNHHLFTPIILEGHNVFSSSYVHKLNHLIEDWIILLSHVVPVNLLHMSDWLLPCKNYCLIEVRLKVILEMIICHILLIFIWVNMSLIIHL